MAQPSCRRLAEPRAFAAPDDRGLAARRRGPIPLEKEIVNRDNAGEVGGRWGGASPRAELRFDRAVSTSWCASCVARPAGSLAWLAGWPGSLAPARSAKLADPAVWLLRIYRRRCQPGIVDRVPLLIVLIWPIVIDSARGLAAGLCRALGRPPTGRWLAELHRRGRLGRCLADRAIAGQCSLWRWHARASSPCRRLACWAGRCSPGFPSLPIAPGLSPSLRWLTRAVAVAALVILAGDTQA